MAFSVKEISGSPESIWPLSLMSLCRDINSISSRTASPWMVMFSPNTWPLSFASMKAIPSKGTCAADIMSGAISSTITSMDANSWARTKSPISEPPEESREIMLILASVLE